MSLKKQDLMVLIEITLSVKPQRIPMFEKISSILTFTTCYKPVKERVQALADILHSVLYAFAVYKAKLAYVYVVTATKPMHRF